MENLAFRFVDRSSGLWVFVDEGVQPLVALSKWEQIAVTGYSTGQQLLMLAFTRRKIISSYCFEVSTVIDIIVTWGSIKKIKQF